MRKERLLKKTAIEPKKLIGTKWISMCDLFGDPVTVEFVDKTTCIYTSQLNKYPETYTVTGGEIFIRNIEGAFELRGNMLFNNDLPAFEKAA